MLEELRDKRLCELILIQYYEGVPLLRPPDQIRVLGLFQEARRKSCQYYIFARCE